MATSQHTREGSNYIPFQILFHTFLLVNAPNMIHCWPVFPSVHKLLGEADRQNSK